MDINRLTLTDSETFLFNELFSFADENESPRIAGIKEERAVSIKKIEATEAEIKRYEGEVAKLEKKLGDLDSHGQKTIESIAQINNPQDIRIIDILAEGDRTFDRMRDFNISKLTDWMKKRLPEKITKLTEILADTKKALEDAQKSLELANEKLDSIEASEKTEEAKRKILSSYIERALVGNFSQTPDALKKFLSYFYKDESVRNFVAKALLFPDDSLKIYQDNLQSALKEHSTSISKIIEDAQNADPLEATRVDLEIIKEEPILEEIDSSQIEDINVEIIEKETTAEDIKEILIQRGLDVKEFENKIDAMVQLHNADSLNKTIDAILSIGKTLEDINLVPDILSTYTGDDLTNLLNQLQGGEVA